MRDFKKFMEENRAKLYAMAEANSKHDAQGHCLLSKDDPWMKETVWDKDYERLVCMEEAPDAAAAKFPSRISSEKSEESPMMIGTISQTCSWNI